MWRPWYLQPPRRLRNMPDGRGLRCSVTSTATMLCACGARRRACALYSACAVALAWLRAAVAACSAAAVRARAISPSSGDGANSGFCLVGGGALRCIQAPARRNARGGLGVCNAAFQSQKAASSPLWRCISLMWVKLVAEKLVSHYRQLPLVQDIFHFHPHRRVATCNPPHSRLEYFRPFAMRWNATSRAEAGHLNGSPWRFYAFFAAFS